jgi:hypothetical protein
MSMTGAASTGSYSADRTYMTQERWAEMMDEYGMRALNNDAVKTAVIDKDRPKGTEEIW